MSKIELSDWLSILSIIVNSILAIWIVSIVQDKLTNKRVLKDHFINEIKELRIEYRLFFNQINSQKLRPKQIIPWFKLMNIKTSDLMDLINQKHTVNKKILSPYQKDLKLLITELNEFTVNYNNNDVIKLGGTSLNEIIIFQQKNNHIFNDLILKINDKK